MAEIPNFRVISSSAEVEEGQKVVLINCGIYSLGDSNPAWSRVEYRDVVGEVISSDITSFQVLWNNGRRNTYNPSECTIAWYDEKLDTSSTSATLEDVKIEELDKLILPKDKKDDIISVLKQFKHQKKIFDEWGLGDVIEYGKGMTMMFWGPPGTGKTWGATCIAKAMGKELQVLDVSQIQTSEPGGANRNIQNAFSAAKGGKKIVFIDECDSLIFDRSNLGMILGGEVNTLLTEIERFEGIVILSTNRIQQMDEALERRISLILEFPRPDKKTREQVWERFLPEKMPRGRGVSAKNLAQFDLSGGQIKNVILNAARFAVSEESEKVEMKHIERAMKRIEESAGKMGRDSRRHQSGLTKSQKVAQVDRIIAT